MAKINLGRDFFYFRVGQLIAMLANRAGQIAIAWWILTIQNNATALSLVLAISTFVKIVTMPLLSPAGDRFSRKYVAFFSDFISMLAVFFLSLLALSNIHSVVLIMLLLILLTIGNAIAIPINMSIVPMLVAKKHLQKALEYEGALQSIGMIIGAAFGGSLVAIFGIQGSFFLATISFLCACLFTLKIKKNTKVTGDNILTSGITVWAKDLKSGFKMLINIPLELYWAILSTVINFVLTPFIILCLPYFVKFSMKQSAIYLVILEASVALGMFIASMITVRVASKYIRSDIMCVTGLFLIGVCVSLQSELHSIVLSSMNVFILGNAIMLHNINANTRRMLAIPEFARTRLSAISQALVEIGIPIGLLVIGFCISKFTIHWTLMVMGLAPMIAAPLLYLIPKFLFLMKQDKKEIEEYYAKAYPHAFNC